MEASFSGKWRRSALDDVSRRDGERKILRALRDDLPLEFSIPFGGYKSHRMPSYPHLDWAEVFTVNFLRRYAASVAAAFPGKIVLTFSYSSGVMDLVNNLPLQHQEIYAREFASLLDIFSDDRVQLRLFDIATLVSSVNELRQSILDSASRLARDWRLLPTATAEKRYRSAERNLNINGVEDLSSLSPEMLRERILTSAMLCEALDSLSERREFNKFSTRIQLVHVRGPTPAIHIASCDTSANHSGVGTGVAEVRPNRCLQRIVTGAELVNSASAIQAVAVDLSVSRSFAGLLRGLYIEA